VAEALSANYEIGNSKMQVSYIFTQAPCNYNIAYSAKLENGEDLPAFMHLSTTSPALAIESKDSKDAGDFKVVVTATLANLYQDEPALGGGVTGNYLYDANSPPTDLLYQKSVTISVACTTD
jgi:hypothetical protein